MQNEPNLKKAVQLVNWITEKSVNGIKPLQSAEDLAEEYILDQSFKGDEARIDSLINWETTKNFSSGFITGLGGILTFPVAIPAAFAASWIIQARMAAAIAKIAGYDLQSDRVKTFIIVSLVGDACKDVLKASGICIANGLSKSLINQIPGKVLTEMNKKVGFRLITKAGEKGAVNLTKTVPLAGGIIGGVFDSAMCRIVGKEAKRLFLPTQVNANGIEHRLVGS